MAFFIKKIIAYSVYPLSLCLTALVIGLFFIRFTRKQKTGKIILTIGVVALILFSNGFFPDILLHSLENRCHPLTDLSKAAGVKWIVVLGGGISLDPRLPANGQLSSSSLVRLVEGIRIHNRLKNSKLLLSGGAVYDPVPEARIMSEVALSLGVNADDIVLEINSRDTDDQARLIRGIAKMDQNEQFILVTNAAHMPRCVALFKMYGIQPIPAPIDFWVKDQTGFNPKDYFPTATGLQKMERVFHEYLGILWAKIKTDRK